MQVHNSIKAIVLVLERYPIAYRSEVIAEMEFAGWLYAGKNPLFHACSSCLNVSAAVSFEPSMGNWSRRMK